MAVKKINTNSDNLYVSMYDVTEKRKSLLTSLKDSLVLQEEHESLLSVRDEKREVLKAIKKGMDAISSDYQKLKKILPDVKNVLAHTENELSELEVQANLLKKSKSNISSKKVGSTQIQAETSSKVKSHKKSSNGYVTDNASKKVNSNLSKLDRVRNNLKVIEDKLKGI